MIRCTVFDFDGTLVDSNHIKRKSYYAVVEDVLGGAAILDELLAPGCAGNRYDVFRRFAERAGPAAGPDDAGARAAWAAELARRYTERCEELIVTCEECPGAGTALRLLRASGRTIYINSGTPEGDLVRIIRRRSLDRLVDGVFGAPRSKEENLRAIMTREGVSANETVMIGDGEDDRMAAEAVGCPFIAAGPCGGAHVAPHLVPLADLSVLPDVVDRLGTAPDVD